MYAGKPEETPTEWYVVGAEESVMKLVADYKAEGNEVKGRTVYCDRFFGTGELVDRYNSLCTCGELRSMLVLIFCVWLDS